MKSKTLYSVAQIIGTCAVIPMYFVKLIHEVAVLPTEDGGTVSIDYYYSVYDKFGYAGYAFVVWTMIAIEVASIVLYIFNIACGGKFNKICLVAFIAQIGAMLLLMFISATYFAYCY